jgi:hypothetical protein
MTNRRHHRLFCAALAIAAAPLPARWDQVAAQPPRRPVASAPQTPPNNAAVTPALAAKLTASYQAAIDGKPLRELLRQIAGAADFNLWIDRHIDPDQLVSLSGGQKTVFVSLVEASQAAGADVVAVGNIVLIGQRERIGQLAGAIMALPREGLAGPTPAEKKTAGRTEIRWPEATTPTEALRIASPQTAGELPHDHWPAVAWRDLSPQIATLLVTSQFDLMPPGEGSVAGDAGPRKTLGQTRAERPEGATADPQHSPQSAPLPFVRLAAPPLLTLRYPGGTYVSAIRMAATNADPHATLVEPRGATQPAAGLIELSGSPAAHVAAIAAMLTHAEPRVAATVDIDNVRFTLNLRGAPAQDVLVQLAAAAGRKLQVTEQATTVMRRTITFDVQDQSLRQLVKTVTEQIGASAQWSADTLTIAPSP